MEAEVEADHPDLPRAPPCLDESFSFRDGEGDRLLEVDVEAGVERRRRDGRVQMRRYADHHGVQAAGTQKVGVIRVCRRTGRDRRRRGATRLAGLGDRHDARVTDPAEYGEMNGSRDPAAADHADTKGRHPEILRTGGGRHNLVTTSGLD